MAFSLDTETYSQANRKMRSSAALEFSILANDSGFVTSNKVSFSSVNFGKIYRGKVFSMKLINAVILMILLTLAATAQKTDDVLAKTANRSFTIRDLSVETQAAADSLPTRIFATRTALLDKMVNQRLLDMEAKATGVTGGKIVSNETVKVANPAETEIKAIYDANRQALGNLTLEQARNQIVSYLKREPEQQVLGTLFAKLKAKYKYAAGKPVNSPDLAPADVVAIINLRPITAKQYEDFAKIELYELRADVGDLVLGELNQTIYNALITVEAESMGIDPGDLIAREITNKMKEISNEERIELETSLNERLTEKYKVNILYKAPEPVEQNISVDDDPATGPGNAPVTVVMFTDFQCPSCAAANPVLKKTIEAFPGKIRLVVRDFPLEGIHENAFKSALAAGAAGVQGKFFQYSEILYQHQDALDSESLKKYAAELGLNVKQFELDFNSAKTAAEVRKDIADGRSYVVNSTPTIFVNGVKVRDLSPEGLRTAIMRALRK